MTPATVSIGHTVNMILVALDTLGNPMLTQPTPDSPPTWVDAQTPAGDMTLTVDASGLSASELAVAAGTDVVTATIIVGGVTFTATQDITVSPAPQVLGSFEIQATVV